MLEVNLGGVLFLMVMAVQPIPSAFGTFIFSLPTIFSIHLALFIWNSMGKSPDILDSHSEAGLIGSGRLSATRLISDTIGNVYLHLHLSPSELSAGRFRLFPALTYGAFF